MSFSIRSEFTSMNDRISLLDANVPSEQRIHRVYNSMSGKNSYTLGLNSPGLISPEGMLCCSGILEIFISLKVVNDDGNIDEVYRINVFYDDSEPPAINYFGIVDSNITKSVDWVASKKVSNGNTLSITVDNILSSNFTISDETSIIIRLYPGNLDLNEITVE